MSITKTQKALIYIRAGGTVQERASAHAGQDAKCRAYARANGYEVVRTFSDDGSGNARSRPGFDAMQAYLGAHQANEFRVLMADPQRLARSVGLLLELRGKIRDAGGSVEFAERLRPGISLAARKRIEAERVPER